MNDRGIITGVSVSHETASLEQLERVSVDSPEETITSLLDTSGVEEAYVLQTCNRIEAYVVGQDVGTGEEPLGELMDAVDPSVVQEMNHEESLRHLLRVAAGLESLVVGEDQIIGQVRKAYETARQAGGIGPILETGITKAIRVGERARTETAINEGVVSLASAAVTLADERWGLDGERVAVVGAGEMGTRAAKHLAGSVEELVLINRTPTRAQRVRGMVEPTSTAVRVHEFDELIEAITRVRIVITATGSDEPLVQIEELTDVGETFIVDITRPRDIPAPAAELPNLTVYDLDSLEAVTEKTRTSRREAAAEVEAIVDAEFERLLTEYKRNRADRVISAMYESAERVKAGELDRALAELDLDGEEEAAVNAMADAIVSQLLAAPTKSLRNAAEHDDWSTIHTALQLFDPHFGPDDDGSPPAFVHALQGQDGVPGDVSIGERADD